jgi:uncharacterized protein YcnI
MTFLKSLSTVAAAFTCLSVLPTATAQAHATLEQPTATVGKSYKAVVRIGHGCDKAPTTRVVLTIPEGVVSVRPMPKPGWTLETIRGPYERTYELSHGRKVSEGVKQVIWSGGRLLDEHYDEFVAATSIAPDLKSDTLLHFPVVQTCEAGEHRWVDVPAVGQTSDALKSPAPAVRLVAATEKASASRRYTAGNLVIEAPWTRATPPGARVAGGYVKITNNGREADRIVGGSLVGAERVEIHEMAMTDGVMRMRQLGQGLEIKPGETVELKPGGYHVMFMGLGSPIAMGAPLRGTLVFEKAGTVSVEFDVAPIGASGAGGHGHH